MNSIIHPALPLMIAAVLALITKGYLRSVLSVVAIAFAGFCFHTLLQTPHTEASLILGHSFHFLRIDPFSVAFIWIFIFYTFASILYSLKKWSGPLQAGALAYAGSALITVLAGDWILFFIGWELMAVFSAILIWNPKRPESLKALYRYLLIHVAGGLILFTGILIHLKSGGSVNMGPIATSNPAFWFIFIGFAVNAGLPPFHTWVPDAYPESTPQGGVYLCAFTTKVACYAFGRSFMGEPILLWFGAAAAVYGVFYALIQEDTRKLLSYHIICQVGYILCGFAIGTPLAINAAIAHTYGNILFKGLLFMATGSMLSSLGSSRLSELMQRKASPIIGAFFLVGAFAISGMPGLNGYVSKTLLLQSASKSHLEWLSTLLLLVAIGTFVSIGLKLFYFAFLYPRPTDQSSVATNPPQSIPWYEISAMSLLTLACFLFGLRPEYFSHFLPHAIPMHVYDNFHIIESLQILAGSWLGFYFLRGFLKPKAKIALDLDLIPRKLYAGIIEPCCQMLSQMQDSFQLTLRRGIQNLHSLYLESRQSPMQSVERSLLVALSGLFLIAVFLFAGYLLS